MSCEKPLTHFNSSSFITLSRSHEFENSAGDSATTQNKAMTIDYRGVLRVSTTPEISGKSLTSIAIGSKPSFSDKNCFQDMATALKT